MAEATATVEVNVIGYDPEEQPLTVAYGKGGRTTKAWWKGEEISYLLGLQVIDCMGRRQRTILLFDRMRHVPFPTDSTEHMKKRNDELIAHQQKMMDEMKAFGFEVLLAQ